MIFSHFRRYDDYLVHVRYRPTHDHNTQIIQTLFKIYSLNIGAVLIDYQDEKFCFFSFQYIKTK